MIMKALKLSVTRLAIMDYLVYIGENIFVAAFPGSCSFLALYFKARSNFAMPPFWMQVFNFYSILNF